MKYYKIIFINFIILYSCDFRENRFITISNDSNSIIYTFYTNNDISKNGGNTSYEELINSKSVGMNVIERPTWEEYLKSCDNHKIRFYIIKKDSVDKYGWNNIYTNEIYNKKYLFTIEDLNKINWKIIYDDK